MSDRVVRSAAAFAIALACALPAVRVAGQAQTPSKSPSQLGEAAELLKKARQEATAQKNYKAPRTAWGEPDLQGVWSYATTTTVSTPSKANDSSRQAKRIGVRSKISATTVGATSDETDPRVCSLAGGTVWYSIHPGKATRVVLRLPRFQPGVVAQ